MNETSRVFIALDPDELFKKTLDERLQGIRPRFSEGVKWDKPEQVHLTLAFLGETDNAAISAITDACREATLTTPSFSLIFDHPGMFPPRGKPSVLWLGCAEQPALLHLASAIRAALHARGIHFDGKPFRPHLTLARVKPDLKSGKTNALVNAFKSLDFAELPEQGIKSVTIYRSELRPEGAVHSVLADLALLES